MCIPSENEDQTQFILETEVIDTGIGISQERQQNLFELFKELELKQKLNKNSIGSIGMGLECSKRISVACGGDISIKISVKNLTVFAFKIPC